MTRFRQVLQQRYLINSESYMSYCGKLAQKKRGVAYSTTHVYKWIRHVVQDIAK